MTLAKPEFSRAFLFWGVLMWLDCSFWRWRWFYFLRRKWRWIQQVGCSSSCRDMCCCKGFLSWALFESLSKKQYVFQEMFTLIFLWTLIPHYLLILYLWQIVLFKHIKSNHYYNHIPIHQLSVLALLRWINAQLDNRFYRRKWISSISIANSK